MDKNNIFTKLRKAHCYTQVELAKFLNIHQTSISEWETNKTFPDVSSLEKLSKIYNVSVDTFFANHKEKSSKTHIPVLGTIPAGIPIEMVENVLDYEDIDPNLLTGGQEYFALQVKGDSMSPVYLDKDVLIVRKQDDCESGEDCIVTVNGFEATFKKVIKDETGIILQPLNHDYAPQFLNNKQIEELPVRILGVVVEIRRTVKKSNNH